MRRFARVSLDGTDNEPCKPFLVTGTRVDGSRLVLGAADHVTDARRLAKRLRKFCTQYQDVSVESITSASASRGSIESVVDLLRRSGPLGTCAVARKLKIKAGAACTTLQRALKAGHVERVKFDGADHGMWQIREPITSERKAHG